MSMTFPSLEDIQTLQQRFSGHDFVEKICWTNNKIQVDVLGERVSISFQADGIPTVSARFDNAEAVVNKLTQFIKNSRPTLTDLLNKIVEEIQRAFNLPIVPMQQHSPILIHESSADHHQQQQPQQHPMSQPVEDLEIMLNDTDEEQSYSISEINAQLKYDVDEARRQFGDGAIHSVQNNVFLRFDTSFLDNDMCHVLGFTRAPVTISLEFTPSYKKEPLLPVMKVVQEGNSNFFAATQIREILKRFIMDLWLSFRNPKYSLNHNNSNHNHNAYGASTSSLEKSKSSAKKPSSLTQPQRNPLQNDPSVDSLMSMGFSRAMALQALSICESDLNTALDILLSGQDILPPTQEVIDLDEDNGAVEPQHEHTADSDNIISQILQYMNHRLTCLTSYCIICDKPHSEAFFGVKPVPCDNQECHFKFQELGIGANVMYEIENNPKMVDLLISMAVCAASSTRAELLLDPFPTDFIDTRQQKRISALKQALDLLPPIKELSACNSEMGLRLKLNECSPYAYRLLRWIVATNRALLTELPQAQQMNSMDSAHQFRMASSPPEKEAKFVNLRQSNGSFYAFHGSLFENWHAILRKGLKNCSGTKFQLHGAAMGSGIYLASNSGVSIGYSRPGEGWKNSIFGSSVSCIALCEVAKSTATRKNNYGGGIHVIPDEDAVCTRYFFVYPNSSIPSVEASDVVRAANK